MHRSTRAKDATKIFHVDCNDSVFHNDSRIRKLVKAAIGERERESHRAKLQKAGNFPTLIL